MKSVEDIIREVADHGLTSKDHFVVDVRVSTGSNKKVSVLLDGDSGVTIDDCANLSRFIGETIEEKNLISSAYTLDVGTPGLDTPLKLQRQYVKNVGRKVRVKTIEGEVLKGILESVDDSSVTVKLKNGNESSSRIEYSEIDWTKVQVSFNKR